MLHIKPCIMAAIHSNQYLGNCPHMHGLQICQPAIIASASALGLAICINILILPVAITYGHITHALPNAPNARHLHEAQIHLGTSVSVVILAEKLEALLGFRQINGISNGQTVMYCKLIAHGWSVHS